MPDQTNEIIKKPEIQAILTRAIPGEIGKFQTFDEEGLTRIAAGMPEIHRATRAYGRKNTQTTNRLMTLTMLADASPFRVIRQCLAQIEAKRGALKEAVFRRKKDLVKLEHLCKRNDEDDYRRALTKIKIEELEIDLIDSTLYIEGALKDLASFQSAYQQVCKNHNIPENWDEVDAEKLEVEFHLRMAFLHGYRDIMAHGRLGMGTLEYLQQFGVHPHLAFSLIEKYINSVPTSADYEHLEGWLDLMVEQHKDEYKKVLKRIGLDTLVESWALYTEGNNGNGEGGP